MEPVISVIIKAFDRKEFLNECLESVFDQTLDRRLYEIILVKNFKTDMDTGWERRGVKILYSRKGWGEALELGILKAKGSIIAFLDDDDLFVRDKLKKVYDVFLRYQGLAYYHHNSSVIDEKGDVVRNFRIPRVKGKFLVSNDTAGLYKLILLPAYFNLSCAAIRKDLALKNIKYVKKTVMYVDDLFAYIAIASGDKILCDDAELTKYRIHKKNVSILTDARGYGMGYKTYMKMGPLFEKLLLSNNSEIGIKILHSRNLRTKMNEAVLQAKEIKKEDLYNYVRFYSIPLLIYAKKADLFLPLVIFSLINRKKAADILLNRQIQH